MASQSTPATPIPSQTYHASVRAPLASSLGRAALHSNYSKVHFIYHIHLFEKNLSHNMTTKIPDFDQG